MIIIRRNVSVVQSVFFFFQLATGCTKISRAANTLARYPARVFPASTVRTFTASTTSPRVPFTPKYGSSFSRCRCRSSKILQIKHYTHTPYSFGRKIFTPYFGRNGRDETFLPALLQTITIIYTYVCACSLFLFYQRLINYYFFFFNGVL